MTSNYQTLRNLNDLDTDEKDKIKQEEKQSDIKETELLSMSILFILFFMVLNEIILQLLYRYKRKYPWIKYIQPTAITTLIGVIAGVFLNVFGGGSIISTFQADFSQLFFQLFLPPILFESALNMDKKNFFKNIGTILAYAIFGTMIATVITTLIIYGGGSFGFCTSLNLLTCLIFGSIISATDPVAVLAMFKTMNADRVLYALVFGESILNDAVALILYESFAKQVVSAEGSVSEQIRSAVLNFLLTFFGSILIGAAIGILCALYLNKSKKNQQSQSSSPVSLQNLTNDRDITLLLLIPWVSYLIAQSLQFSGIVAIMSCGIMIGRYAMPNLTDASVKIVEKIYGMLASVCENVVFLFIGIGLFGFKLAYQFFFYKKKQSLSLVFLVQREMGILLFFIAFLAILFARFANLFLITNFINCTKTREKISGIFQFVMWFSGFRGAMGFFFYYYYITSVTVLLAYALSIQSTLLLTDMSGRIILTLTIYISIINIFVQGTLLLPILEQCNIQEKRKFSNDLTDEFQSINNNDRSCCKKISQWIQKCEENVLQQYNTEELGANLLSKSQSKERFSESNEEQTNNNNKAFELTQIHQQQNNDEEKKEEAN